MLLTNYSYNAQKYITAWFKNQSEAGAKKDGLNGWVLLIKRGAAFSTCLSSFCWRILVGDGGLSSSTLKHKNTSMINTLSRINRSLHFFLSFSAWSKVMAQNHIDRKMNRQIVLLELACLMPLRAFSQASRTELTE